MKAAGGKGRRALTSGRLWFLFPRFVGPWESHMHRYRTHSCGALRRADAGRPARLSGWIHRKRDHGNLLFLDLRDHYGITQCVIDVSSPLLPAVEAARPESVVTVTGRVVDRPAETINPKLPT